MGMSTVSKLKWLIDKLSPIATNGWKININGSLYEICTEIRSTGLHTKRVILDVTNIDDDSGYMFSMEGNSCHCMHSYFDDSTFMDEVVDVEDGLDAVLSLLSLTVVNDDTEGIGDDDAGD